jgi:molybdenum cofactor cytidylyltransferase
VKGTPTVVLAAIVLAAGESSRMGAPKALLADGEGRPFIARLTRTFLAAGVDEIVVVTGRSHDAIAAALERDHPRSMPRVARNTDPSRGQLSSLWVGLDAVHDLQLDAVLMIPVDVPMVKAITVRAVVDAWRRNSSLIARPVMGARHGHPVLFDRGVFDELRRAPLGEGAKAVVRAHGQELLNVEVDDEGCLIDVDTPADYAALIGLAEKPDS